MSWTCHNFEVLGVARSEEEACLLVGQDRWNIFRIIQIFLCLCAGGRRGPGGTMLRATPSRPSSARTARTCSPGGRARWAEQTNVNPIMLHNETIIILIIISGPESISPSCLGEDHNHKVVIAMNIHSNKYPPPKPSLKPLLQHRKTTSSFPFISFCSSKSLKLQWRWNVCWLMNWIYLKPK